MLSLGWRGLGGGGGGGGVMMRNDGWCSGFFFLGGGGGGVRMVSCDTAWPHDAVPRCRLTDASITNDKTTTHCMWRCCQRVCCHCTWPCNTDAATNTHRHFCHTQHGIFCHTVRGIFCHTVRGLSAMVCGIVITQRMAFLCHTGWHFCQTQYDWGFSHTGWHFLSHTTWHFYFTQGCIFVTHNMAFLFHIGWHFHHTPYGIGWHFCHTHCGIFFSHRIAMFLTCRMAVFSHIRWQFCSFCKPWWSQSTSGSQD